MRNVISEFIEYTDKEKSELWDNATFVFDTNVFLNMYRYKKSTSESLINAMEKLSPRIWMPHHVAYEFMKNRYKVIDEISNLQNNISKSFDKYSSDLKQGSRIFSDDTDIKKLRRYFDKWLSNYCKENLVIVDADEDTILNRLLELFDGKTDEELSEDELSKIKTEGKQRYAGKIPPGYMDANKNNAGSDNNTYGDLIIWKEILKYSSANSKDIILILSDKKEDWWHKVSGKTIGPRPELKKEFSRVTNNKFHMYTMENFISIFNEHNSNTINAEVISEVRTKGVNINDIFSQVAQAVTPKISSEVLNAFSTPYSLDTYGLGESVRKIAEFQEKLNISISPDIVNSLKIIGDYGNMLKNSIDFSSLEVLSDLSKFYMNNSIGDIGATAIQIEENPKDKNHHDDQDEIDCEEHDEPNEISNNGVE